MNVLIVTATKEEVQPLLDIVTVPEPDNCITKTFEYAGHNITILIAGVGMVNTALFTSIEINHNHGREAFEISINAGICGCFDKTIPLGSVVNITEDTFSDLGVEEGENFFTLEEINMGEQSKITNEENSFENIIIESLPKVNGITVNTVHGNKDSIAKVVKKFNPTVESMEGAAFMLTLNFEEIDYVQIRAVSNYVEVRNKDAWNIPLAIKNLNNTLINILETL